jgi:pantoate kinase
MDNQYRFSLERKGMNDKNINQMFKKLSEVVNTNIIQTPHPTLVAFGISAAITIAVAVGISVLTADHSQLACAWWRRCCWHRH